jgi:hypothetical protein
MKKFVLPLFSCLLVLSLLLGSFGTAKAAPGDNPTVTPVSGDTDLTTEVIAIASLPGVTELAGGMLAPAGFPAGEAQFGGNGIRVSAMDSGKATACFYLSAAEINQGWGGKVGVWDGTQWVLLATSISLPEETNNAIACATISGNGTYAFIKYVTEPDKLPTMLPECGEMTLAIPYNFDFNTYDGWMTQGLVLTDYLLPLGTPVSFQIIAQDPPGFLYSGTSGSGIVSASGEGFPGSYIALVDFDPMVEFTYDYYDNLNSFVFRVFLPGCYTDFTYPDDIPAE